MPKRKSKAAKVPVAARCEIDHRTFPVALSELTPDGCCVEDGSALNDDVEFLHLTIADRIDINGRVLSHRGQQVRIGFFGQIHPQVVRDLQRITRAAA